MEFRAACIVTDEGQAMRDAQDAAKAAVNDAAVNDQTVPGRVSISVRHRHSNAGNWLLQGAAKTEYYCSGTLSVSTDGTVTYDCAQTDDPSGRCEHVSFPPSSLKDVKVGSGGNLHLASRTQGNFDFYGSSDDIKQAQAAIAPPIQQ